MEPKWGHWAAGNVKTRIIAHVSRSQTQRAHIKIDRRIFNVCYFCPSIFINAGLEFGGSGGGGGGRGRLSPQILNIAHLPISKVAHMVVWNDVEVLEFRVN